MTLRFLYQPPLPMTTANPPYWSKTLCGYRTSYAPYEFLVYACSMFGLWPTIFDAMYVFTPYTIGPCITLGLLWIRIVLYAPSTFERYRMFMGMLLGYFTLQCALTGSCIYFLATAAYHPGYLGVNVAGLALATIGSVCCVQRLVYAKDDTALPILGTMV